jgi:photosystem II oxygen-evolving enhancer protein 1
VLSSGSTNLKDLKAGTYKLERFCMEPTAFSVKEESQFKGGETNFVATKLMTRLTYTLDGVRAVHVATCACEPCIGSRRQHS